MKNILLFAALAAFTTGAFAESTQGQKARVVTTAAQQQQQQAASEATNAGNNQTITVAPVTTNIASDLKDQGATAAAISAAAAIEIAKIQAGVTGDRDLSADQRAALDRQAAIDIAKLQQTVKNTPSIALGQLTSSNDTCMGSVSVGGSGPGFSIGVGTTYTDDNCKMLKNSRELWNMGMKAASLALMCTNTANREALELTGFECPQTAKARQEAEAKAAAAKKTAELRPEITDPIVRERMGLVALSK